MADTINKAMDAAKGVSSKLKSILPDENEQSALREKQQQIDAATLPSQPATATQQAAPSEQDKVNPLAQYGSRSGEKRIDTSSMTKPLVPVYDKGGEVKVPMHELGGHLKEDDDHKMTVKADPLKPEDYLSRYGSEAAVANRPEVQKPEAGMKPMPLYDDGGEVKVRPYKSHYSAEEAVTNRPKLEKPKVNMEGSILGSGYGNLESPTKDKGMDPQIERQMLENATGQPDYAHGNGVKLYDDGGEVDVNDGKHQAAILEDGERVLTPEENEQYKKEHPEHGAPAGFPGMVLPNPTGIKVSDSDNPEPKPSDTDHLPKGTKTNIDNAPLKTPDGDISNPAAADIKPESMREISTDQSLKLKPYGQVIEDKAKAKAAEHVQNPGVQTETSNVDGQITEKPKEEKPKVTYGHILADQWMQRNGMPSMDSLRTPKEFNQGTQEPAMQEPTAAAPPQGGLKPIVPPTAAPQGKEAFQQRIATYDKAYQAAMDMAAQSNDPQYREQAARIKEAKLAYEKEHPWGSKESAHPGLLGKLGHVAEEIGQRAPGLAPIVSTLPGSEVYRGEEAKGAREDAKEASTENAAENKKLESAGYKQVTGGAIDPKAADEMKGVPQTAFYNEKTGDIIYKGALAPKQSAGELKAEFQKTLAKIGTAEAADPAQQMDAIKAAHVSGVIDDQQYRDAIGYLGSTSNAPATQSAAGSEKKMQGKLQYYDTPTGRKAMTVAEAKTAGLTPDQGYEVSAGQAEKDREKDKTYHVIQKALTQYQKHVGEGKLTPKDITVMTSLTEEADKPDYISKLIAGGFDDLLGHPVTGYSESLMKGTLNKNQYEDLSPAGRQLIADYYTTMMAHFANMKSAQGTIPRSPFIIKTEMNTIPKPYLNQEEAGPAFSNYLEQVEMRNHDNVSFENPKEKTEQAPAAPTGATDEVVKGGKVIGHVVVENGKKVFKALQQ